MEQRSYLRDCALRSPTIPVVLTPYKLFHEAFVSFVPGIL